MSQIIIQDVWPPLTCSEDLAGPRLLRPDRTPVVQGRMCRCVEGGILWPGRCSKGFENVLDQRPEEDNQRGFWVLLSFHVWIY